MTFRIETEARGGFTVFILSGRIEKPAIAELRSASAKKSDRSWIWITFRTRWLIPRNFGARQE